MSRPNTLCPHIIAAAYQIVAAAGDGRNIAQFSRALKNFAALVLAFISIGNAAIAQPLSEFASFQASYALVPQNTGRVGAGEMVVRRVQICDGWQETAFISFAFDGQTIAASSTVSEHPQDDGTIRFTFHNSREINYHIIGQVTGTAHSGRGDTPGRAQFTAPDALSITLTPKTVFPIHGHQSAIRQLRAGQTSVRQTMFEGTDPIVGVSTLFVLATPPQSTLPLLAQAGFAAPQHVWRISESFRPGTTATSDDAMALYSVTMTLADNGIADDMIINLANVVLRATMTTLQRIEAVACP